MLIASKNAGQKMKTGTGFPIDLVGAVECLALLISVTILLNAFIPTMNRLNLNCGMLSSGLSAVIAMNA